MIPSIDEVTAYCMVRKNDVDASKFIAHYAASGWYRGKTKIKDWKACVHTWEQNQSSANSDTGYIDKVIAAIKKKEQNDGI